MLNSLTFAYNCTVHETTGFPPFFLMYGRTPRLPVDLMFKSVLLDGDTVDMDTYVESLGRDLREAMVLAQANTEKQQRRQTELYDRKTKGQPVVVGDRVLLANKGERGKKKLADEWEGTLYTVISKNDHVHTYQIKAPAGNVKTVHRNLILPVNFLPLPETDERDDQMSFSGGSMSVPDSQQASVENDTDDRTVNWVASLSSSSSVSSRDSGALGSVSVDGRDSTNSGNEGLDSHSMVSLSKHSVHATADWCTVDALSTEPIPSVSPPALMDAPSTHVSPGRVGLRTRRGRLIRPVNRLIQTMAA